MQDPIVNIPLSVSQINLILGTLYKQPFDAVEATVQHIRATAMAALNPQGPQAPETTDAAPDVTE